MKFPSIVELCENYFLTDGKPDRALTKEQRESQKELHASNISVPLGGILIPFHDPERRTVTATGGTSLNQGGFTIGTDVPEIGLALRSALVFPRLGGRLLTGLRRNADFPYGQGAVTAQWLPENTSADDVSELVGGLSLNPKRLIASVPVSQQMLAQGGPLFGAWLQAELLDLLAVECERVAIQGLGASSQPMGIINKTGIGAVIGGVNGAAPDITHLSDLEYAVTGTGDAGRGPCGWILSPLVRKKLRQTVVGQTPIWSLTESDRLLGYNAGVTRGSPDTLAKGGSGPICSSIAFGNFGEHVSAFWGPGIAIDFATSKDYAISGKILVLIAAYFDCGIRNPKAFAAMKDALCN